MVKKKKETKKEKPSPKTKVNKIEEKTIEFDEYSISELLEKNRIKPLNAVGFLNYYGLTEDFRKEVEENICINKFSIGEFKDMYERYVKREI